ncbi:MAG: phosphatidate cytidylyltransferase [Anaerolineae bacterium]|nr:phosphatidate cytidylyltransferase [Anaerolineae bacterium]
MEQTLKLSNLTMRLITGVVGLVIVLAAAFIGGWLAALLIMPMAAIGVLEFCSLRRGGYAPFSTAIVILTCVAIVVAFQIHQDQLWQFALAAGVVFTFILEAVHTPGKLREAAVQTLVTFLGVLYVVFPLCFLILIRAMPDGLVWILAIFTMSFGTDTFSYIGGRLWGKNPLAPTLSPKKTIEGAVVGTICSIMLTILVLTIFARLSPYTLILAICGPFVSIAGDLLESGIKRYFHIKDSHLVNFDVIPGHGGVLDRFDSIILVTAFTYGYLILAHLNG